MLQSVHMLQVKQNGFMLRFFECYKCYIGIKGGSCYSKNSVTSVTLLHCLVMLTTSVTA